MFFRHVFSRHRDAADRIEMGLRQLGRQLRIPAFRGQRLRAYHRDLHRMVQQRALESVRVELEDSSGATTRFRWNALGEPIDQITRNLDARCLPPLAINVQKTRVFVKVRRDAYLGRVTGTLEQHWQASPPRNTPTRKSAVPPQPPTPTPAQKPVKNDNHRYVLTITRAGNQGYAFARSEEHPHLQNVYLNRDQAPSDLVFEQGMQVTARIVDEKVGIQGREILAA